MEADVLFWKNEIPEKVLSNTFLTWPNGVCVTKSGSVYVSDEKSHRILSIPKTLNSISVFVGNGVGKNIAGTGTMASIRFPGAMAVDSKENIYVVTADNYENRELVKITSQGNLQILTSVKSKFGHIVVDEQDNLYYMEFSNTLILIRRLRTQDPLANFETINMIQGPFPCTDFGTVQGIAIDDSGNFYLADHTSNTINFLNSTSKTMSVFAGSCGVGGLVDGNASNSLFSKPTAIVLDKPDHLFVSDQGNNVIRKISIQTGAVETFAGNVDGLSGFFDGSGNDAQLFLPQGLSLSPEKDLYITEFFNMAVRVLSTKSRYLTTLAIAEGTGFDEGLGSNGKFLKPWFNAWGPNSTLYVSDEVGLTIKRISSNGYVSNYIGIPGVSGYDNKIPFQVVINRASGIAFDKDGNLYFSDMLNHCIRVYNQSSGLADTYAGICGPGGIGLPKDKRFAFPRGLRFDGKGNLFVVDNGNSVIVKVKHRGDFELWAGSSTGDKGYANGFRMSALFRHPSDLTIDSNDVIHIADIGNYIRRISSDGQVSTIAGLGITGFQDGQGSKAMFNAPFAITQDSMGNLFVADAGNSKIRKITPDGYVSTIAGYGIGRRGGQVKDSFLRYPTGISIDEHDNLYISDSEGVNVKKFDKGKGILFNIAGFGASAFPSTSQTITSRLRYAQGLAVHPSTGSLFLASTDDNAILEYKNPMEFIIFAGQGSLGYLDHSTSLRDALFSKPTSLTFSKDGSILYVADSLNHAVRAINLVSHSVKTIAGNGYPGDTNRYLNVSSFNSPTGLVVIQSGDLLVSDTGNDAIKLISLTRRDVSLVVGTNPGFLDGPFNKALLKGPRGIALDGKGNLVIADTGNHAIRFFNMSGRALSTLAGNSTRGFVNGCARSAAFNEPTAVTIDSKGNIYVADTKNNAIRVISEEGCVTTLAIKLPANFYRESLKSPSGLIIDLEGNLIVSDSGNNAIIRVILTTQVAATQVSDMTLTYSMIGTVLVMTLVTSIVFLWKRRMSATKKGSTYASSVNEKLTNISKTVTPQGRNSRTVTYTLNATKTLQSTSKYLAIPGYLELDINEEVALDKKGKAAKGGTASVKKGTLSSARLKQLYGEIQVAIKYFEIKNNDDSLYMFEVALMASIPKCPNLIQLLGYCMAEKAIVMQYYGGNLEKYIKNHAKGAIPMEKILKIAMDIVNGMKTLHQCKIVHFDLKPLNVLIDESNFTCLICDFGFAHFLGDEYSIVSGLKMPLTAGLTYAYASPELLDVVLNHETMSHTSDDEKKIDVYAFAITLYQILVRKSPWEGLSKYDIYDKVSEGNRPEFLKSESYDKQLVEIITNCWDQKPENRPDFENVYGTLNKISK